MKPFVVVILAAGALMLAVQRKPVTKPAAVKSVLRKQKTVKPMFKTDALEHFPQRFAMQLLFR